LFDPNLIGSPIVIHEEYNAPNSSRRKKKEDVQELSSASEETALDSPGGGGGDKVDKEEKEENVGEEDKKEKSEVTPLQKPLDEAYPSKKRNVSPTKPTSRKKAKERKPNLQTILMINNFDFIIAVISDAS
jgi:hypothetical protein